MEDEAADCDGDDEGADAGEKHAEADEEEEADDAGFEVGWLREGFVYVGCVMLEESLVGDSHVELEYVGRLGLWLLWLLWLDLAIDWVHGFIVDVVGIVVRVVGIVSVLL